MRPDASRASAKSSGWSSSSAVPGSGVRPKLARPQRERRVGQARDLRLQPGDGVERRVEPAQIEIDWRASEAREALAPPDAVADGRAGASRWRPWAIS